MITPLPKVLILFVSIKYAFRVKIFMVNVAFMGGRGVGVQVSLGERLVVNEVNKQTSTMRMSIYERSE